MKKTLYIALAAICFACTTKPIDEASLFLTEQQAQEWIGSGSVLTIQQFLDRYMTEQGNFYSAEHNYRSRAYNAQNPGIWFFSIDTIAPSEDDPVYIRGRITTDDYAGNFYKVLCIQQIVDGEQQALRISVDAGSVGGLYQIGQEILIRVDGLAIGRYANQPQLCVPSYNNNYYAQKAEEKVGWAPGRIPMPIFKERVKCIGLPDVHALQVDTVTIDQFESITDINEIRKWDGKLVCLKDVYFTGQYYDDNKDQFVDCTTMDPEYWPSGYDSNTANVFAPNTKNLGYPQSRIITDGTHNTNVSTSEYAKFAYYYLPGANGEGTGIEDCPSYKGTVCGIVGYYQDKASDEMSWDKWAISIRSLDDLDLYDEHGSLWPRIEYAK